jgi:uncharacterized membrane protein YfhO
MRNSIDKQTYRWLFNILHFFGAVLILITGLLMIDLKGFAPVTLTVTSVLLLMLLATYVWLKIDYAKQFKRKEEKIGELASAK